jgi:aconitate hydratase
MGVLPLQFMGGENAAILNLTGRETFTASKLSEGITPLKVLEVSAKDQDGKRKNFRVTARLDSEIEIAYYINGGILQYVLRQFLNT